MHNAQGVMFTNKIFLSGNVFLHGNMKNKVKKEAKKEENETSLSRLRPSSLQICVMRLLMTSPGRGLNLNFAHLEASGSMIL
jgi:hypothetical protein